MSLRGDIQGHWIRDWIKAPGFEDHTTRVHWMQVGMDYADVRIPSERPDLTGASALRDLPPAALAQLAQAEGFAGRVTLSGDQCTWQRAINWHGTPEAADVGAISFDGAGRMIEAGVLAEYTELWRKSLGAGSFIRLTGGGYTGFCARIGDTSVLGIGDPERPATKPVLDALATGQMPEGVDALFNGLHLLGHWTGTELVADLATNPFVENQPVLRLDGDKAIWHRVDFHGRTEDIPLRIAA